MHLLQNSECGVERQEFFFWQTCSTFYQLFFLSLDSTKCNLFSFYSGVSKGTELKPPYSLGGSSFIMGNLRIVYTMVTAFFSGERKYETPLFLNAHLLSAAIWNFEELQLRPQTIDCPSLLFEWPRRSVSKIPPPLSLFDNSQHVELN